MPEEDYTLPLDADQISNAILNVHGADTSPVSGSGRMVTSGGLYTYLASFRPSTGYGVYDDSALTEAAPLVVNGARVQLTVDGLGGAQYTDQLPSGVTGLWDTTGSYLTPENVGDAYNLRISFRYKSDTKDSYFDMELDISPLGDGSNVILLDTIHCVKDANTEARYAETHYIFSREAFVANGGRIFINSTGAGDNISIYAPTLVIGRSHKAI